MLDLSKFITTPLLSYNDIPPSSRYQVEGEIFQGEEDVKCFFLVPGTPSYRVYPLPEEHGEQDGVLISVDDDLSSIAHQLPSDFMKLYAYEVEGEENTIRVHLSSW